MIGHVPSGGPAGPAGCAAAGIVLLIAFVAIGAFITAVWWLLRDMGGL